MGSVALKDRLLAVVEIEIIIQVIFRRIYQGEGHLRAVARFQPIGGNGIIILVKYPESSVFFETWDPLGECEDLFALDFGLSGDCALHAPYATPYG